MNEKFLQAWKEFNKIEKEDVELGLYRVLSLRDIEDGIAYFTVIDPVKLKFPCTLKKYKKKGSARLGFELFVANRIGFIIRR